MPDNRNQPGSDWRDFVRHAAASSIGMRRTTNQDAWTVVRARDERQWRQHGHLFVVADGMGAHAAGEMASRLAVETIPDVYRDLESVGPAEAIRRALVEANAVIHARGLARPEWLGMGTTCSTLLLVEAGAIVAHVGDSRVYRIREGMIEQLTFDHSLVWELMDVGKIPEHQVPQAIPKNVITRSIGPNASVQVDVEGPFAVEQADRYLLCSDGLTGLVDDEEIGQILLALPLDEAADTLINLANLRGGPDNITVVAVEVVAAPPERRSAAGAAPAAEPTAEPARSPPAALRRAVDAAARFLGIGAKEGRHEGPPRHGAAPYRATPCCPTRQLAETLADTVDKLRQVLAECGAPPDQGDALDQAAAALADGDLPRAVGAYSRLMDRLFTQLREHGDAAADLSPLD